MSKKPTPTAAQDGLPLSSSDTPSSKPIILLLGISAALLLGVGSLLFDGPQLLKPAPATSDSTIVTIEGKSELQLKADLVRIHQELEQAKAEREATLKSIEQVSQQLQQQLKEASLTLDE